MTTYMSIQDNNAWVNFISLLDFNLL
jgi:hypothetical protein